MHHPTGGRNPGQVVGWSDEEEDGICGRYEIDRPCFDCDSAKLRAAVADAALEASLKCQGWERATFKLAQVSKAITNWRGEELEAVALRLFKQRKLEDVTQDEALGLFHDFREIVRFPDWWEAIQAVARSPHSQTPKALRGDQERLRQLGKLAELLQFVSGSNPFYLSVGTATEFLGWDATKQRSLGHAKLKVLQARRLLIEETKGQRGYGGRPETASRWLWAPAFSHTPTALKETEGGRE